VIVVEAGEKSGTLITAGLALDQGRDLFAIPGDIFKQNSYGCNQLIKKGEAKIVTCLEDILEEYNFTKQPTRKQNTSKSFESKIENDIYHALVLESLSIDELSKKL
jgi:DNA processing protein